MQYIGILCQTTIISMFMYSAYTLIFISNRSHIFFCKSYIQFVICPYLFVLFFFLLTTPTLKSQQDDDKRREEPGRIIFSCNSHPTQCRTILAHKYVCVLCNNKREIYVEFMFLMQDFCE